MDIIDYLISCNQYAEFTDTLEVIFGQAVINLAAHHGLITITGSTAYLNIQ